MSGNRIAAVAAQHCDELRSALRTFAGSRADADSVADPAQAPTEPDDHLRERLDAAADFADLPPQILLPAQVSHNSPHRRGAARIG